MSNISFSFSHVKFDVLVTDVKHQQHIYFTHDVHIMILPDISYIDITFSQLQASNV